MILKSVKYRLKEFDTTVLALKKTFLKPQVGNSQTVRGGMYQNIVISSNLCVLFFQAATKLSGQIFIKLFEPKYFVKGSVRFFFWYKDTLKKLLRP